MPPAVVEWSSPRHSWAVAVDLDRCRAGHWEYLKSSAEIVGVRK
jgi:hypothetical protein